MVTKMTEEIKKSTVEKQVTIDTSLFSNFNLFNKGFKEYLFGLFPLENKNEYLPAIIAVCYQMMGFALRNHSIIIGVEIHDTRYSYIIEIKSGHGKKIIFRIIKEYCSALGNTRSIKIVSSHAEQFIGKKIFVKMKGFKQGKLEEVEGYLRYDWILCDDAYLLLSKKEHEDTRNYLIQSLDPFGENEITKKLVDHKPEDALCYCPNSILTFFTQDKNISKDSLDTGLGRKMPIIHCNAVEITKENLLARVMRTNNPDMSRLIKIAKIAKKAKTIEWVFNQNCHDLIADRVKSISKQLSSRSKESSAFIESYVWSFQNLIYRFAATLAGFFVFSEKDIDNLKIIVSPEICEQAIKDATKLVTSTTIFWEKFVVSTTIRQNQWEEIILKRLKECGAISKESAIPNDELIEQLHNECSISKSTLRNAETSLVNKGFINRFLGGKATGGISNSFVYIS